MLSFGQQQKLSQTLKLAPGQILGIKLLAKSLPELRADIATAMAANPAIEDVDHPLETPLSDVERKRHEDETVPDYPEDDFTPGHNYDEEAAERRQAFFDNQVKPETLQDHLLAQLPLSDIPREDWGLVEVLVGDLDAGGYYRGSVADACMAFGKTEAELTALREQVMALDPPGCCAITPKECLLAQIDTLADSPYQDEVREIIEGHLEDMAAGRFATIEKALGIDRDRYVDVVKALRTLKAHPGNEYPGEKSRAEYVNPEVHAVDVEGHWYALTDKRSLPEIRISKKFMSLLADPNQTPEIKAYVRERIEAAKLYQEAIANRQETVESIAQAVFDRQQAFFTEGFKALRPLTEVEVADMVGVSAPTVSRTVRDKYASTPFGTIELRRFFATGVKLADGESVVSQEAALRKLKEIVDGEDRRAPWPDEKLVEKMKAAGYAVARRTVAKYRDKLGIPPTSKRRLR